MKQHRKLFSTDFNNPDRLIKARIDKFNSLTPRITKESLTYLAIHNKICLTERNTTSTRDSFDNYKGIESFMHQTLPKIRKLRKKEKDIELFTFLPSTNHNVTNTPRSNNALLKLPKHKPNYSIIKMKPLVLINKTVQLQIKKAIVAKKFEDFHLMPSGVNQEHNDMMKSFKTKEDNTNRNLNDNNNQINEYKRNRIILGKNDILNHINLKVCFPIIIKDNNLFSDIYQYNLNYLKQSLRIKYNSK